MADCAVAGAVLLGLMPAYVADDYIADRAQVDQQSVGVKILLIVLMPFEIAESPR